MLCHAVSTCSRFPTQSVGAQHGARHESEVPPHSVCFGGGQGGDALPGLARSVPLPAPTSTLTLHPLHHPLSLWRVARIHTNMLAGPTTPQPAPPQTLLQVARIDTGKLTVAQILEQVQSRAEEMDTMQASVCSVAAWLVLKL